MIEHNNITAEDHCPYCTDDGMVTLKGTVTVHKVTYSRGMAPCKWCEEGARRFVRAISPPRNKDDHHKRWKPAEDFTKDDVDMPEPDQPTTKAEAKRLIATIRPQLGAP